MAVLMLTGDLGSLDPQWAGWILRNGNIYSPEGLEVSIGDVRSVPFLRMQLATYQTENRKLREPKIEEQPAPSEWIPFLEEAM